MTAPESLSAKPDVRELARERELALLTYKLELGEAKAEGRVEGRVHSLMAILARRELDLHEDLRGRIVSCTDVATLDRWIDQAITARSAAEALS